MQSKQMVIAQLLEAKLIVMAHFVVFMSPTLSVISVCVCCLYVQGNSEEPSSGEFRLKVSEVRVCLWFFILDLCDLSPLPISE